MNPKLENLHAYPFEKLKKLLSKCSTDTKKTPITLAIGEPKHQTPKLITEELKANIGNISIYPTTRGTNELKTAIIDWLCKSCLLYTSPSPRDS